MQLWLERPRLCLFLKSYTIDPGQRGPGVSNTLTHSIWSHGIFRIFALKHGNIRENDIKNIQCISRCEDYHLEQDRPVLEFEMRPCIPTREV